jgi:hypothetical protein
MNSLKKLGLVFVSIMMAALCYGQDGGNKVEMADMMRSNGRIYVVVAVVIIILVGLILYVARIDKKITKLENEK